MCADDAEADLLRKFQAAIAGAELADLRKVAADLGALAEGCCSTSTTSSPGRRLAAVLDDPAHFDLDALNEALRGPYFAMLTKAGAAAQRDPARLWDHLASRVLPGDRIAAALTRAALSRRRR